MYSYNPVASLIVKVLSGLPFLPQLKLIMDWTFTRTSLNLFQWFQLEDFWLVFYDAKMDSKLVQSQKVGQKQSGIVKCALGWCAQIVILLIILGPLLLFSSLYTLGVVNPLTGMDFQLSFISNQSNSFQTYPFWEQSQIFNLTVVEPGEPSTGWLPQLDKIQIFTQADTGQIQKFYQPYYSDANWDPTAPQVLQLV